jgi:[protein-PII] uridylyltransferase
VTEHPVAQRPVAEHPVAERQVAERQVAERQVAEHPVTEHLVTEHLVTERLAIVQGRTSDLDGVAGPALRRALVDLADAELRTLFGEPGPGVALVAVGGFGRGEPAFGSDLDLVLLHNGRRPDTSAIADGIWYPLWDAGIGLDHSVRTIDEAVKVADTDLKAALGLLDARTVAGDKELVAPLLERVRSRWRARASRRLPELAELVADRARRFGEVPFLLEPDLKESRGGLRDVHALHALAAAWVADSPGEKVLSAYRVLLDARGEVRRLARGRGQDRLLLQEQEAVAAALAYPDSLALARAVADAGRTISWTWDVSWNRAAATLRPASRWRGRRPIRRPLAEGVVEQEGEVMLARGADPGADPVLVLRAAAAAARAGLPLARATLDRLARAAAPMPEPWPDAARDNLVALLATGPAAVPVLESLDQVGLLVALIPEWAAVRSKPQRNPYHRYTVDRHLMETAAGAAAFTRTVDRPDLLLLGALLHDLGKGFPGDHTEAGIAVVERLGPRLGLPPEDVTVILGMIRNHLLLGEAATRRDIDDVDTIRSVAESAGGPRELALLHALTEADSRATGKTAWSPWKARLISELVERADAVYAHGAPPPLPELDERQRQLLALPGEPAVAVNKLPDEGMYEVVVVAGDRPGLLASTAGVLALHRLDVRRASARNLGDRALLQAAVAARHGEAPEVARLRQDIRRALAGTLDIEAKLASREQAYAGTRRWTTPAPPRVRFDDTCSTTVVEVRAPDAVGVLFRSARALAVAGLDVRTAIVATLGLDVVDAFYIRPTEASGGGGTGGAGGGTGYGTVGVDARVPAERRGEITAAILDALRPAPTPAPAGAD